ncbi:MAG TPA: hypothetical protein VGZ22_23230 [Isosphaeraceae bacterium]|jgi:hypothetical protein|nr:hypothetical protein [Isosphaeraceae bacterium]
MPRLRFRLRTMMILVAVVALGLFAEQTRQKWRDYASQARVYESLETRQLGLAQNFDAYARRMRYAAEDERALDRKQRMENAFGRMSTRLDRDAADIESEAAEARAKAAKAGLLKRYYRSRWW